MADTLRVLMTADTVGGVWTYSLELARALAAQGARVVLATLGEAPDDAQRRDAAEVPGLRLVHGAWRLEWMEDPWADVEASGRWLLKLPFSTARELVMDILRYGPDVEVLAPGFLRDAVADAARRTAAQYGKSRR